MVPRRNIRRSTLITTSLAEVGNSKQQCYGCGKVGRKRNDCPDKKQGNGGRNGGGRGKGPSNNNKGNYKHCCFKSHTGAKCWKKHPELRPDKSGACIAPLITMIHKKTAMFRRVEVQEYYLALLHIIILRKDNLHNKLGFVLEFALGSKF